MAFNEAMISMHAGESMIALQREETLVGLRCIVLVFFGHKAS